MIEELVSRVFTARNLAHLAHWKTKSYSQHMALGDFYDSIIDALDEIVECYQGEFKLIGNVPLNSAPTMANITQYIKGECEWLDKNRDAISQGDSSIGNLVDSLHAIYQRTLYKLVNLQ